MGTFDGDRLTVEEVHRFPNDPVEQDGVLRWDVDRLRDDVWDGLRQATRDHPVESVAVDSWGVDFGLLDGDGRVLQRPAHYRNARRAAAFESVLEVIPPRELYGRTGIQLLPINTIFELAASAGDRALADAHRLLLIPDLFHHWLCGSDTTEWTNATTTQCFDPFAADWARDLLDRIGAPTEILPEVVAPGTSIGAVVEDTAAETGLRGAQVVAGATHDTGAAVAAIPLRPDGCAYLSIGTWSLVGIESTEPVVGDDAFRANVTNEGGVDGTYRVLRNVTGLWLLEECRRAWAATGRVYDPPELVELARSAEPFRSVIDPNDPLFAEPGDMPARISAFCRETGQTIPAGVAETVRCIFESLALKHAETIDQIATLTGRPIDELHVVGGGARNELLCAWTADASGRVVLAGPGEATVIGNLLVQALALGEIASLEEGRELVRASFDERRYEPARGEAWRDARARFSLLQHHAGVTA